MHCLNSDVGNHQQIHLLLSLNHLKNYNWHPNPHILPHSLLAVYGLRKGHLQATPSEIFRSKAVNLQCTQ